MDERANMNRVTIKTRAVSTTHCPKSHIAAGLGVGLILSVCGCGSDPNELLHQTVDSAGRVLVDNLLTDLANAVAEIDEQNEAPDSSDPIDDGTDDPVIVPPPGDVTADAMAGESVYVSNNCGGCHCADAAGGFALNAPALIELAVEILDASLVGDTPHVGGKSELSAQELADLEAYLASLTT